MEKHDFGSRFSLVEQAMYHGNDINRMDLICGTAQVSEELFSKA